MRTLFLLALVLSTHYSTQACIRIHLERTILITDRHSNTPLANVKVTLEEEGNIIGQAQTDSNGKADFWIYYGTYQLRVSHPEYLAFVTKLKVDPDYHLRVAVQLSKTKHHKIRITEIPVILHFKSIVPLKTAPLNADISKDECFHKSSCIMQHYSRAAMQEQKTGTRLFNELLVYPNPAVGGVIYVESKFDSKKTLLIYNLAGTEMMCSEIVLHQAIDTSQLPTGIYFLKVIDEKNDDVTVKKILVP